MKKNLLSLALAFISTTSFAQTIVSTTAQNKKVVLEEFTGIHCVYCPQGHAIAQGMKDADPNNVFLINIHVGGYATPNAGEPDFRTPFGTAIANQSGLTGYPSGTVNRHVFTGSTTALGRGSWNSAGNVIKNQASYVNVAVESSINVQNNQLTVHVEGYYTGTSLAGTNKLNVALLQNNTKGPQTGGGAGNEYNHMHRLVHMITGQWGEDITTTTAGTFVDRTYTYTIPTAYNGVPVDIAEMEIVAFIAEGQQEIISGNGSYPSFTGIVGNDINGKAIASIANQCKNTVAPTITIQNVSQTPLTSLNIAYDINGTAHNYNWTGSINPMYSQVVNLPATAYTIMPTNTVTVTLPSDDNNANNVVTTSFAKAVEATNVLTLTINTDAYGDEVSWNIKNQAGTTIANGGPYANNTTVNVPTITLPADDCYTFNLIDSYGDGGGAVTLKDSNNIFIYTTTGAYGSGESRNFASGSYYLGNDSNVLTNFAMYPNPTNGSMTITTEVAVDIVVSDITGKTVYAKNNVENGSQINLSSLQTGVYVAKITSENAQRTEKIIIK